MQKASAFSLNLQPYLPHDAKERLKAYKYDGEDRSLIYKYFWKPLCASVVEMLPMWLPPNVITVTALVPVVIMYFVSWHYMPFIAEADENTKQVNKAPSWVWVATAASVFFYQLLDNLDGYQARRTKTPSPLGMMLDHSFDAVNCCFQALTLATALQLGATWKTLIAMNLSTMAFFLNTLEHHYTGKLILPIFNGPNEGLAVSIALYLWTAFNPLGCSFWLTEAAVVPEQLVNFLVSNNVVETGAFQCSAMGSSSFGCVYQHTIPLTMLIATGIGTWISQLANVYRSVNAHDGPAHGIYIDSQFINTFPFLHVLTRTFPVVLFQALSVLWFANSPSNIFVRHPRLYAWTCGFLVTKLTLHIMVSHMLKLEFHPWRRSVVPFFFLSLHSVLLRFAVQLDGLDLDTKEAVRAQATHETVMLFEFFILSLLSYVHAAVNILIETAMACDRDMFSIKKLLAQQERDEKKKTK